ncbi:uncharacterized protein LOC127844498 [Dreissena polymorpha]|uniref:uncharacterized protein LOC127844498 n=1 Tax=Dreissena polymorpha TaxID=45954 RepID=UPI002264BEBA|nr:uncharacterized protein LOC127844498 [Dreissena polymorpha]
MWKTILGVSGGLVILVVFLVALYCSLKYFRTSMMITQPSKSRISERSNHRGRQAYKGSYTTDNVCGGKSLIHDGGYVTPVSEAIFMDLNDTCLTSSIARVSSSR